MSRLIRIRDALDRLVIREGPRMREMQSAFEREARAEIPGPAHLIDAWLIYARDNFEDWWHARVNILLGDAIRSIDDEDRLVRVTVMAGSDLEELFSRYQIERVYHRLPRQAMSSEAFENYVIEMVNDRLSLKRGSSAGGPDSKRSR